jgi:hypothetical protein
VVEERPLAEKYVALGYVWSSVGGLAANDPRCSRGHEAPGRAYLWVDRLFIDQSNPQEKQLFISRMDAIYEGAEFTIVAAAGDARTGLPGIHATLRQPQPRVGLKEHRTAAANLASCAEDPIVKMLGVTEAGSAPPLNPTDHDE